MMSLGTAFCPQAPFFSLWRVQAAVDHLALLPPSASPVLSHQAAIVSHVASIPTVAKGSAPSHLSLTFESSNPDAGKTPEAVHPRTAPPAVSLWSSKSHAAKIQWWARHRRDLSIPKVRLEERIREG